MVHEVRSGFKVGLGPNTNGALWVAGLPLPPQKPTMFCLPFLRLFVQGEPKRKECLDVGGKPSARVTFGPRKQRSPSSPPAVTYPEVTDRPPTPPHPKISDASLAQILGRGENDSPLRCPRSWGRQRMGAPCTTDSPNVL